MGITFEQVTYRYKERSVGQHLALDHLDLSIPANQFITILGAPGSGKSTLLQHLNGLIRADHGVIHIQELNMLLEPKPAKLPKGLNQKVGLVFQYPEQQLFSFSIWEDLLYGPLNFNVTKAEAELAAKEAAKAMELDDELLHKSPYELSSGQLRKAAIAAVLAANPEIIILDEPTASLDATSRKELMELLHIQCHKHQRTVIVVTHDIEEVISYTDHVIVMHEGRTIYSGEPLQLMERTELMQLAGIEVPSAYRLYNELKLPLQLQQLSCYPAAAELAASIQKALST